VDTLERVEIMRDLRLGIFDVLVGVNLLREGLDLPEVSLVAILDADKEGFLRSERSLTQTAGRAARNVDGLVIMYADKITKSMARTIEETERRRIKQMQYNEEHGITPTALKKSKEQILGQTSVSRYVTQEEKAETERLAADPVLTFMNKAQLEKSIGNSRREMEKAAKALDFITAAKFRDELLEMERLLAEKKE